MTSLLRLLSVMSLEVPTKMSRASPFIRCVVVGDAGVGKTSLIIAAATDSFNPHGQYGASSYYTNEDDNDEGSASVGGTSGTGAGGRGQNTNVLPPTRLPVDVLPELVPLVVSDTNCDDQWKEELEKVSFFFLSFFSLFTSFFPFCCKMDESFSVILRFL